MSATTRTPRTAPSQPTSTAVAPGCLGCVGRLRPAGGDRPAPTARPASWPGRRPRRARPTTPRDAEAARRSAKPADRRASRRAGPRRRPRWRRRSGARRRPRPRRPAAAARRASTPGGGDDRRPGVIRPVVTVPVLSSTTVSTAPGRLQHLRALDQDAELGAAAGADQQRGRRGQAERARAGDDQHRDRGGERGPGGPRRRRASRPACATATPMTTGTNTAETRSASRCTGALPVCACSTSRAIWASWVSAPTRVARTTSRPPALTQPPVDRVARARPRPARTRR